MSNCNFPLGNIGQACPLDMSEVKKIGFSARKDASGNLNKILKTDAATLAAWQLLFNLPDFSANVLDKVVVTPELYDVVSAQEDARVYSQGGFRQQMGDGDYAINFALNKQTAKTIGRLKAVAKQSPSAYLFDKSSVVWGVDGRVYGDPLYIYPIANQDLIVPNFNLPAYETASTILGQMWLQNPADMNGLIGIQIADGSILNDDQFYSLEDIDTEVSLPAATGCTLKLSYADDGSPLTGVVFGDIKFYSDAAPLVAIAATAATETPEGTYAVLAPLAVSTNYTVKVTKNKFNIAAATVAVA
jgi:hypothetical protein